jgi:choline-sulfatase
MPPRKKPRSYVLGAGPGESEYTRYDRAIADTAVEWLRTEAGDGARPWVLFVGFVSPHFPLVVPDEYFALHPRDALPLPVAWAPESWPRHPALDLRRRQQGLDAPFDEATLRRALAAYYGLVSFLDDQVGRVLAALDAAGLAAETRVIYTTDHGEMLGEHGLWWKSTMYEGSVAVPLIAAGPDVPAGRVARTTAMLVDLFPSVLEAVGVEPSAEDRGLPGESLWRLAREPDRLRDAFSEYHAVYSPSGVFMLRSGRYKYVHYVNDPPQLFDLEADPDEMRDLGADPAHVDTRADLEARLRRIVDPEEVDRRARAAQRRRIDAAGGAERIVALGDRIPYTPAPEAFAPARPDLS